MNSAQHYRERREEEKKYILELSNSIRDFKEIRASVVGMSIRSTYALIAHLSLLMEDVTAAKSYFYKGAKITAVTFDIFKTNRYPHLKKIGPLPFTSIFVKSFPDAIVCGSHSLVKQYASAIYEETKPADGL